MNQLRLLSAPRPPEPTADPNNAYTPDDLARALVAHLVRRHGLQEPIWEAHAGGGAFVRALIAHGLQHIATDIDPACGWNVWDAARGLPPGMGRPWGIVGNPPWSEATNLLPGALRDAEQMVSWILPATILGRVEWGPFLRQAWPEEILHLGRIGFGGPGRSGGGSGMTDCALFTWLRRPLLHPEIQWMGQGITRRMVGDEAGVWP